MLHNFFDIIIHLFSTINYWSVFILMILEASVFPIPSEIPMVAIGIQAANGTMNIFVGVGIGLLGIWIGTSINYALWYYFWDKFVTKYGKYFFIKQESYERTKKLFSEGANFYTFFGRFIPVVRHLISLPAGVTRMNYWRFTFLSLAWSGIWLLVLVSFGYFIGENTQLIHEYIGWISLTIFCWIGILVVWRHRRGLLRWLRTLKKQWK